MQSSYIMATVYHLANISKKCNLHEATGEGNGHPLQYSCRENSTDGGAWQATVLGVARVGHDLATKESERLRRWMC